MSVFKTREGGIAPKLKPLICQSKSQQQQQEQKDQNVWVYANDTQKNIRIKMVRTSLKESVTKSIFFFFTNAAKCFSSSKGKRNCSQSTTEPCFRNLVWQHLALLQMLVTCLRESWAEIRPTNRWASGHALNFNSCCFRALHHISPTALHLEMRGTSATSIFRALWIKNKNVIKMDDLWHSQRDNNYIFKK